MEQLHVIILLSNYLLEALSILPGASTGQSHANIVVGIGTIRVYSGFEPIFDVSKYHLNRRNSCCKSIGIIPMAESHLLQEVHFRMLIYVLLNVYYFRKQIFDTTKSVIYGLIHNLHN